MDTSKLIKKETKRKRKKRKSLGKGLYTGWSWNAVKILCISIL